MKQKIDYYYLWDRSVEDFNARLSEDKVSLFFAPLYWPIQLWAAFETEVLIFNLVSNIYRKDPRGEHHFFMEFAFVFVLIFQLLFASVNFYLWIRLFVIFYLTYQ